MTAVVAGKFFGDGVDLEINYVVESGGLDGGEVFGRDGEGFGGEKVKGGEREDLGLRWRGDDGGGEEAVFTGGRIEGK